MDRARRGVTLEQTPMVRCAVASLDLRPIGDDGRRGDGAHAAPRLESLAAQPLIEINRKEAFDDARAGPVSPSRIVVGWSLCGYRSAPSTTHAFALLYHSGRSVIL